MSKSHKKFAHFLLADVAKEMAANYYEELAKDDEFYKFYPSQKMFIQREHRRFIDAAKAMLSLLLGRTTTPEWQKEIIFDALVKHASMPGNIDRRVAAQTILDGDIPILKGTVH